MSISPTCLLPVERNDEKLRMSVHLAQKLRDYVEHFLNRSKCVGRLFSVTLHLSTVQMTKRTNKMKHSRANEVQANSALCLTSSSGNNELRSFFFIIIPGQTSGTHVEFWIPTNGYDTATAHNWPHPVLSPSFNCLHSTLSSFSSLFIPVSSLSYFFLRSFPLLTLSFILSFPARPTILIHPHTSFVFFWCLIFKPHVCSCCTLHTVKYYFLAEKIWAHLQNTYTSSDNARLPFRRMYCSLNA